MPIDTRRALIGILIASVAGAILFLPSLYFLGLSLAPRLSPAEARMPALVGDAIWARADGGRATALQPINPVNLADYAVCRALESRVDDPQRRAQCPAILPGLPATLYLSAVHLRDAGVEANPLFPIKLLATLAWVTRSWTKAELIDTLAERAEFAFGWRGIDAGARGYFGKSVTELSVPDAALLAAMIGTPRWPLPAPTSRPGDPWCDPAAAREMRSRILGRMRENLAIDEPTYRRALAAPVTLAPAPPEHKTCAD